MYTGVLPEIVVAVGEIVGKLTWDRVWAAGPAVPPAEPPQPVRLNVAISNSADEAI
jgi:hypothetical protein